MEREDYMREALALAEQCLETDDVPVGCVVVSPDGQIIGRGRNRREELQDAAAHAEMEAIREACQAVSSWRLTGCALYVTLEPCPMCAGAILNARIPEIHYAAKDPAMGACGSVLNLFEERFGFHPRIYRGPLEPQCSQLLTGFFAQTRRQGEDSSTRQI